ncbi:Abi family protein [Microbacterium sp. SL62]|uniref:Abi family protein n=1 Tax=Microbacterium sp. SL62 TaxID=2995139 RepID=UPI002276A0A7|nr:Abi family protein [Microbacterium sp. SL62]MCY1718467.1 Abi family protein [Microbacterium sp. SL62]
MSGQHALRSQLLSQSRLSPYMSEAGTNQDRAWDLYLWATQLTGSLHAQISFVELAFRNALDRTLGDWNVAQGGDREWTLEGNAIDPLYSTLRGDLIEARKRATKESVARAAGHPRRGVAATHNDVIAQLMFGSWVKVITPMAPQDPPAHQQALWAGGVHAAFPGADATDASRVEMGKRLNQLRVLRNRVAHHDSILKVNVTHRLNEMLGVAHKLDPAFPALIMGGSQVRRINKSDPRKTW